MTGEDMKRCPFCAELIKTEAIKCRYCGSMLTKNKQPSTGFWYRVNNGKKVAGVCTGIAQEFNSEKLIIPLRLFFVLSTILWGFGLILYIILWLIMPDPVDGPVKKETIVEEIVPPAASEGYCEEEAASKKKSSRPKNAAVGLFLIFMGALLVLGMFAQGYWISIPFVGSYQLPFINNFMYPMGSIWTTWMPGFWTFFIVAGLMLLLLEGFRFIRFLLGCGLVIIGTIFLIIFVPFIPKLALLPLVLIVGVVLVILGIIKLIFGR